MGGERPPVLLIEIGAAASIAAALAEIVSTVLILVSSVAAVVALLRLGRSFSMMAEARRLVTSRPYRYVRHPLYLVEEACDHRPLPPVRLAVDDAFTGRAGRFKLRRTRNEETSSRRLSPNTPPIDAAGPWHLLKPARLHRASIPACMYVDKTAVQDRD